MWLALAVGLSGCGEDEPDGPEPTVVREAEALRHVLTEDPAILPLEEAENVVADGLPVRAAEMLQRGAIPAARRAIAELEGEEFQTPEVQAIQEAALEAYRARLAAVERYAEVLEGGGLEDLDLVLALRAQREAEVALTGVLDRLDALAPLAEQPPERTPRIKGTR